ncbi:MAG: hypothetical protein EA379_09340 [Phycisphaerales bacterium]|nr:MAG: hypothetical protein EA379_09340 [Phycisphaerales bacterium]
MPARRSRTEHWRDSLAQLAERGGALEVSLAGPEGEDYDYNHSVRKNLIWRVRVLSVNDHEIVVEEPVVMRQRIALAPGIELIGVIAIGPNRWMFRTRNLGPTSGRLAGGLETGALRLIMPSEVERCQRRSFYRVSTMGLHLPIIECSALLDPESAFAAEAANQALITDQLTDDVIARIEPAPEHSVLVPEIGPSFEASMVNLGGGGVGLLVEPDQAHGLESHRLFWLMINLTPHIPSPLGVSARLVHTHLDVSHRTYAGMSFEFGRHRAHEKFVVEQICRYVAEVQREQLRSRYDRDAG